MIALMAPFAAGDRVRLVRLSMARPPAGMGRPTPTERWQNRTGAVRETSEPLVNARQPSVLVRLDGDDRDMWFWPDELAREEAT